ncbi:hypothetical protein WMY93_009247 [Mugilogobius chulae]|uniref:Uncharacterized protein n=1 Tax=Mugilogobius chulae TaxID=88201 RepID=A0AAW0PEV0_9GOBI
MLLPRHSGPVECLCLEDDLAVRSGASPLNMPWQSARCPCLEDALVVRSVPVLEDALVVSSMPLPGGYLGSSLDAPAWRMSWWSARCHCLEDALAVRSGRMRLHRGCLGGSLGCFCLENVLAVCSGALASRMTDRVKCLGKCQLPLALGVSKMKAHFSSSLCDCCGRLSSLLSVIDGFLLSDSQSAAPPAPSGFIRNNMTVA